MRFHAFAKINLDLRVIGRRADGYHEVRTILQTIDWCDDLDITPAGQFDFDASCGPCDESNLAVRAVRAFERVTNSRANVRIHLNKRIPAGAGLGGGSADAAVAFLGLQRVLDRPVPGEVAVEALGALGTDVPFFLLGGRAVGVGTGGEVYPLEDLDACSFLLVDSGIHVPTKEAYSWLTLPGRASSIKGFCAQFLPDNQDVPSQNDFEEAVFGRYPELKSIREELLALGATQASLSGSGAVIFGRFKAEDDARRSASTFVGRYRVKVARSLLRPEYWSRVFGG